MLDPEITAFFSDRKERWLKKNIQPDMTESEKKNITQKCEDLFSLENWLPDASKRARQRSISTHPCTFSHPSARKNKNGSVTSIIANAPLQADGYLRSGNIIIEQDSLGSAGALDVYTFLSIITGDGKTVIEHIRLDTELAQSLLNINSESYDNLKRGFMEMIYHSNEMVTSSKIKQVYFPIENGYHQLSILSNSGLIYELSKRIQALQFSNTLEIGRDLRRHNAFSASGYSEIYNITKIGYGGTKPQNISALNNKYGGKAHLLLSTPPMLEYREIIFPTRDFFVQHLHFYHCKEILERLDNIFKIERNGKIPLDKIRKGRDRCLGDILDIILQKVIALRDVSTKQYFGESSRLPVWQKLWLCEQHKEERIKQDAWLDTLCMQITLWINNTYKNKIKNPVMLGEAERHYIQNFIHENREILR